MSAEYAVAVEGLSQLRGLADIPADVERAAYRAINTVTGKTAAEARRQIGQQIAFPARYLTGVDGSGRQRLGVTQKAGPGKLEATITGRFRATSLARFSSGTVGGRGGVRVTVAPGFARMMRRAFLIRLPAGRGGDIETKSNMGLAIRLRPGESIQNKRFQAQQMRNGAYLLYGVSVDQAFRIVRNDVSGDALEQLEAEFDRLLAVDLK